MKTRLPLAFFSASIVLLIGIASVVWARYDNPKMEKRELIILSLSVVSSSLLIFVSVYYFELVGEVCLGIVEMLCN
jgi:hypothetical protein